MIQVPQKWQFLLQHFRNICTKNLTLWVHVQRKVASKQTRKHMQMKKHSSHDLNNGRHHLTQAVQSFPVSSEEGPSLHRDPISQNPQPTFKTIWNSSKNVNYYSKLVCTRTGIIRTEGKTDRNVYLYLFLAAGAVVIFMPEAVHWWTKKANSKHQWHHATNNSGQTWLWSGFNVKYHN